MKSLLSLVALVTLAAVVLSGCKRDPANEEFVPTSTTPALEFVSVNPSMITVFDSLVFTVRYTDGDGDLGFEHPDSTSVELTDNRFPLTFHYHLKPLAPSGANMAITGELPIVLDHVILQNANGQSEPATFSIRIKDRAGRWSNVVTSPAVTVNP